jgi:hypothetical protein
MLSQREGLQIESPGAPPGRRRVNPWVSDEVLLSLSYWWVQNTRPFTDDFPGEVGLVFRSLQQQLK